MVLQNRKALGRGLASLLPESDNGIEKNFTINTSENNKLVNYVEISKIRPCVTQPRLNFKEGELEELSNSIKEVGVLQPILVRNSGSFYEIIAGERRWRACKLLNLPTIPVIIKNCTDKEALQTALIENIQRADLNCIEEAKAYKMLAEEHSLTQEEISKSVGKERSTVSNYLRILKLPLDAQKLVGENKLTMGHARALCSIENEELLLKIAHKSAADKLSVRELEDYINKSTSKKSSKKKKEVNVFEAAEEDLRKNLQTKVNIKGKLSNGKIIINFYSKEAFDRIYSIIGRG